VRLWVLLLGWIRKNEKVDYEKGDSTCREHG